MKQRTRNPYARWTARLSLALAAILTLATITSRWRALGYALPTSTAGTQTTDEIQLASGGFSYARAPAVGIWSPGWFARPAPPGWSWLPARWSNTNLFWGVAIPAWIPILFLLVPALAMRQLAKPFPPHRCQRCGFDLSATDSLPCPECGTPPT